MNLTGGIVLFVVTWFLTFYVVLQLRTKTQGDVGHVVPGTPIGAPAEHTIGRSALIATVVAIILWSCMATVLLSGWITLEDIDFRGILPPEEEIQ